MTKGSPDNKKRLVVTKLVNDVNGVKGVKNRMTTGLSESKTKETV